MTWLRYNDRNLLALLGGGRAVIESPLIQELMAERMRKDVIRVLSARFGTVPQDVIAGLQGVPDEAGLDERMDWAACCPDLEAFRTRLAALPPSPPSA
jgi:hypothetical protein